MSWLVLLLVVGGVLPLGAALWALIAHYKAHSPMSFALAVGIGLLAGAAGGFAVCLVVIVIALGLRALR